MIDVRKRPMCWLAIGFLLIICVLMLGRSGEMIPLKENEEILLEGNIVSKEYKESVYGGYWQIVLKEVRGVVTDNADLPSSFTLEGKQLCQITKDNGLHLKIGQRILVKAKYVPWESPTNEGQFDSKKYYLSNGIVGQFKKGEILKAGLDYSLLKENMWRLRQQMQKILVQQLGSDNGGLIGAMLLGDKSDLSGDDKSLYQRNGISHILAISGLHLSMLGMGIYKVLLKIMPGKKQAAYICIIIMSLYCVFTGNSISTIRATIMFALSLMATILGRSYDSLSALGLTAMIQLFLNPYVLNNSGFLLSFLAVIGVTFLSPELQQLFSCKRKWEKSLCVSLSATLTTLPVVLTNYGTYPWYSVFLNILILPAMSALLLCAILLLLFCGMGNVWALQDEIFLIHLLKVFIQAILGYFEVCCEAFEQLILQEGYVGAPHWFAIFLYGILLVIVISDRRIPSVFLRKMLLLCAVGILTMKFYAGVEITMLDVGQGDGVVIRNANGNVYLSDCGSSSVSKVGKYRLIPFLKYKGYGKIKGIFLSHMDEDHMNGILELLEMAPTEHILIEHLFLPESVLAIQEDRKALEELKTLASKNDTTLIFLAQGEEIVDESLQFTCLYPKTQEGVGINEVENRNNSSLVMMMQYKEFEMLFTGDVEKEGEWDIVRYEKIKQEQESEQCEVSRREDIDILKVAHHGSSGSTCAEFLEEFRPKLSLISCGRNNSYGHPHKETLERLLDTESVIMTTPECGAIKIKVSSKGKVLVSCYAKDVVHD